MKTAIAAITLVIAAGSASAQSAAASSSAAAASSTSNSASASSAYGGSATSGGVNMRMLTTVAPSVNHTAPCVIGHSFGLGPVAAGGGTIASDCQAMLEAEYLMGIAGYEAAISHLYLNSPRMAETLVRSGIVIETGRMVRRDAYRPQAGDLK